MVILKRLLALLHKKKLRASSLTEVLVATVLIVLVLGIAIATLNNVLQNNVTKQTQHIETKLFEIQYLYRNGKIKLPFNDEFEGWNIVILKENNTDFITLDAEHSVSKRKIVKKMLVNEDQ